MTEEKKSTKFLLYKPENIDTTNLLTEQFKTKLEKEDSVFIKDTFKDKVGEPHPFDYEIVDGVAKKFGIVSAVTDKICDFTLGPGLFLESDDERVIETLEKWMRKTRFKSFLRPWFREALRKGPGYLEIAGLSSTTESETVKVVNSNTMYVKRDEYGITIDYNQYIGKKTGQINDDDIIECIKDDIIQLDINKIGNSPYGMGIVYSALPIINDFLSAQHSSHKIMSRKANSQIHVKMGDVATDDFPEQADIDAFGAKLQFMNDSTEWVTGPNVEMSILDFGKIGEKFKDLLDNDLKLMAYSFQVPEVVLGKEGSYVGSSEVQESGFERNIKSYQEQIAFIIKTKIFDKVLLNEGKVNVEYEIVWGQDSEEEKNKLRESYQKILSSTTQLSPGMKIEYEKKLALLDEIDFDEVEKENKRVERKEVRDGKRSFQQDVQLKGAPPGVANVPKEETIKQDIMDGILTGMAPQEIEVEIIQKYKIDEQLAFELVDEEINDWEEEYELTDWVGEFVHIKHDILEIIKKDNFDKLKAVNRKELGLGKLSKRQVNELRNVFEDAFENKKGLHKIAKDIDKIGLKDRYIEKDGKKILSVSKEKRAYQIARTETVRLRAEGSLNAFGKKNIGKVVFTTVSARPCPICQNMEGDEYLLNEAVGIIPVHVSCRCRWEEVR